MEIDRDALLALVAVSASLSLLIISSVVRKSRQIVRQTKQIEASVGEVIDDLGKLVEKTESRSHHAIATQTLTVSTLRSLYNVSRQEERPVDPSELQDAIFQILDFDACKAQNLSFVNEKGKHFTIYVDPTDRASTEEFMVKVKELFPTTSEQALQD